MPDGERYLSEISTLVNRLDGFGEEIAVKFPVYSDEKYKWNNMLGKLRLYSARLKGDADKELCLNIYYLCDALAAGVPSSLEFLGKVTDITGRVEALMARPGDAVTPDMITHLEVKEIHRGITVFAAETVQALNERHEAVRRDTILQFTAAVFAFAGAFGCLLMWSPTHTWPTAWLEFVAHTLAAGVLMTFGVKMFSVFRSSLHVRHLLRHWVAVLSGIAPMVTKGSHAEIVALLRETFVIFATPPQTGLTSSDDASPPVMEALRAMASAARKAGEK